MTVSERIKQRRIALEMTQDELAQRLGYTSRSSINKIEKNAQNLPQSKIDAIAKILKVTPSYLMGWETLEEAEHYNPAKIPILGNVAAGIPIDANEDIIGFEEIPERYTRLGDFFALRLQGNSMEPRMCENDVVIVKKQPDAENGDIVIVSVARDTATCKRLRKYADGSIELISNNPSYDPMFFDKNQVITLPVEVLGVVIENRQKFKIL